MIERNSHLQGLAGTPLHHHIMYGYTLLLYRSKQYFIVFVHVSDFISSRARYYATETSNKIDENACMIMEQVI